MTNRTRLSSARSPLLASIAAVALLMAPTVGFASDSPLVPDTKVRITVVQWMPMKGAYEEWAALGGEYTITDDATLVLPVIGSVSVGRLNNETLADEISRRIQARLGTVEKPDATVQVVEYPPVYVVGDVETPGAYNFRQGLNVLQALALGGGELKPEAERSRDQIRIVGDLQRLENQLLRTSARIARLNAEQAQSKDIGFPPAPADAEGKVLAAQVFSQERTIRTVRANELERQTKSLEELRELFKAEIDVLQQKITAADANITTIENELKGVSALVDRGIATTSRRSELERALSGSRSDRLDQVTAVMRARQGIAEATRSLDSLRDSRQTEIASELQSEQAALEQTILDREVAQKLLLEMLSSETAIDGADELTFAIVRQEDGRAVESPAEESTPLRPGDVVKVTSSSSSPDEIASGLAPTQETASQ